MDYNKRTGDETTDFHQPCEACGQPFTDCQCERCEVCGELVGKCECTDEDMNRWAYEQLYPGEDEAMERFRNYQMARWRELEGDEWED